MAAMESSSTSLVKEPRVARRENGSGRINSRSKSMPLYGKIRGLQGNRILDLVVLRYMSGRGRKEDEGKQKKFSISGAIVISRLQHFESTPRQIAAL